MHSVSRLYLHPSRYFIEIQCRELTCVDGKWGRHEGRGGGRGNSRVLPARDQQALIGALGTVAAMIARACAMVSQGDSNDLQHLEAYHPPMAIEGGVDDIRGIRDMGAGTKRKEDHSSFNPGKKQRTSVPQVSQVLGQCRVASQAGQMVCVHCR